MVPNRAKHLIYLAFRTQWFIVIVYLIVAIKFCKQISKIKNLKSTLKFSLTIIIDSFYLDLGIVGCASYEIYPCTYFYNK